MRQGFVDKKIFPLKPYDKAVVDLYLLQESVSLLIGQWAPVRPQLIRSPLLSLFLSLFLAIAQPYALQLG